MGQGLNGAPLGRPTKEHSRFIALLSLAAVAAFFRMLLQAGHDNHGPAGGPDAAGTPRARPHGGLSDGDRGIRADRPSLRSAVPPGVHVGSPSARLEPRRYGGTLGPDAGRSSVAEELAGLTGATAWNQDVETAITGMADFPEPPSTVVTLTPEVDLSASELAESDLVPAGASSTHLSDAVIETLAEIEALPEIERPRRMPAAPADDRARRGDRARPRPAFLGGDRGWRLALLAITGLALALRLVAHSSNYDVFIDEITYSTIGQAVAAGHGVVLYGTPFFLHPPLFFYLEAGVLQLFGGVHAAPVQLVLDLRPINCVIGAIECFLLMQLISRFSGRRAALLVGVFVAVDPFLLLWDGRVLLETQAMTLAVAGWLCLDWIARVQRAAVEGDARGTRGVWAMTVLGGLLFGASLLSKETYAFVGVAPLLGMFVIGSPLARRITGGMFAIAAGCYGIYLVTVALAGHLSLWWSQNSAGLQRAAGTKQITGFNQAGHHASLGSSISGDLSLYLISYLAIIAIGISALVGVIRWFRAARAGREFGAQRRLAIALGAGAVGYVGYAVVLGAFEVQIFYMCIIGGLPVLVTEARASRWSRLNARFSRRTLLIGCGVLASLALAFELSVDIRLRTERDTSLSALVNYVSRDVPNGAMVDSTDQVTQFILRGVQIDGPTTVTGLERDKPGYVVLDQGLVAKGYDSLGPGFGAWLKQHAHVVFSVTGRTAGRVQLWKTEYANAEAGAQS